MSGILRGLSAIRSAPAVRSVTMSQRANLANRAAKDPLGPAVCILYEFIFDSQLAATSLALLW